jgi:hypothetical protein
MPPIFCQIPIPRQTVPKLCGSWQRWLPIYFGTPCSFSHIKLPQKNQKFINIWHGYSIFKTKAISLEGNNWMQTFEMITYANNQGDQVRRIFAYWAIVYVHKAFFRNYRSSPHFWDTFSMFCIHFGKCVALHFGRFFSSTPLVTLLTRTVQCQRMTASDPSELPLKISTDCNGRQS